MKTNKIIISNEILENTISVKPSGNMRIQFLLFEITHDEQSNSETNYRCDIVKCKQKQMYSFEENYTYIL